jgi:two-component system OmpR family sensor kinase
MQRTLFAKLATGLFLLLCAICAVYFLISMAMTGYYVNRLQQELHRDLAESIVADRNLISEGRLDSDALRETFDFYMSINPSIEIYLLDLQGNILSHSAPPDKVIRNRVSLEPIKSFLAMEDPFPILGDDPRGNFRQKAFSVTPVPSMHTPEGYLYVVLRGEKYVELEQALSEGRVLNFSLLALICSLATGFAGGLIFLRMVVQRIEQLSALMRKFERDQFVVDPQYLPDTTSSGDEIDELGKTFNHMATTIQRRIEKDREQDLLRRTLFAQISHDLRSPLASAQGYLESLQMKWPTMSEEEKLSFIGISLRQIRVLETLVKELFELSSLDARDKELVIEPFPLDELLSDVIQKHALSAKQEGKDIQLSVAPEMPFAIGDVGATERVLDNLLKNAISFSPREGRIDVRADVSNGHIEVLVSDEGPGIPEADLLNVFEPFFTADKGTARHGRHAGLGLAIAKRLVELQHGSIEALPRTEMGGTTFRFHLPAYQGRKK